MSATKSLTFKGRGFWVYDIVLGVFLKHLIDVVEATGQAHTPFLSESVAAWRLAPIYDIGVHLEESWTPLQRQNIITFIEEACDRLATRESVSTDEIGAWAFTGDNRRVFHRGLKEVPTASVVELGRAVIALLRDEQLPEPPKGTAWFFTDTGRSTIQMDPSWNGEWP